MAETGVWALCESPAHAASMAASTSDADLMVTVGDRVVVDAKQKTFRLQHSHTGHALMVMLQVNSNTQ